VIIDTKNQEEPTTEELLQRRMLTVKEAARVLRLNHKTVRDMLMRGELEFRRFGRVIRIPTRAILSLM